MPIVKITVQLGRTGSRRRCPKKFMAGSGFTRSPMLDLVEDFGIAFQDGHLYDFDSGEAIRHRYKTLIAADLDGVSTLLAHWYRNPVLRRLTPPFHNSTRAQEIREPLSCINKIFGIHLLRQHACDLAPSAGQAKAGKGTTDDFLSGHGLNP